MCTYNGAAFLPEQLSSVAAQVRRPDELVVCDDRSTDGRTPALIERFAASAPFPVRLVVNDRNIGPVKNFERAIGLCSGDVICLADQDDIWRPDKLRLIEALLASAPAVALVFADAEVVDEGARPLGRLFELIRFDGRRQAQLRAGQAFETLLEGNVVAGGTMAFRSSYRDRVLPIPDDGHLLHDGWIAIVLSLIAEITFIETPLIKWRQHPMQVTGLGLQPPVMERHARLRGSRDDLLRRVRELEWLRGRLAGVVADPRRLPALAAGAEHRMHREAERLAHFDTRLTLPDSWWRRVPGIVRELVALRYHRHSRGVLSAAKDLLAL
jgi:glycosyltransferase involved in cell wall biosynthesis